MYSNGAQFMMTNRGALPSPQTTGPSRSESEIVFELEQKRRQLDDEISNFRTQKEKEFREFERDLRASRRRKGNLLMPQGERSELQEGINNKPPSRTSSSSALNLLAGRGAPKASQFGNASKKKISENSPQIKTSPKAGPSVCQPVVSLDKLNIKGETAQHHSGRPRTPPTPTLLSQALTRSASSSSLETSPPPPPRSQRQSLLVTPPTSIPVVSQGDKKSRNSFTGLFTPSYIHLLDNKTGAENQSSSALVTPPGEDEAATAPSSLRSSTLNEVLPISSSSYPPNVTISPGGHTHASKRAYTAPTVSSNRIPSALRTASGGAIGRKPKHVTFRLADSAIVEPSSSYEEGPSPQFEDGKPDKPRSGTRSPLRTGKSQLHRTMSPDEEDAEAGVQPGMGMGEVIQKLNEYTVAEAAKHGKELILEVDETEQNEDDDHDEPMEMGHRHDEDNLEDGSDRHLTVKYHEYEEESQIHDDGDDDNEDEEEEDDDDDGYFSPKAKHISTMSPIPRGNSPLTPYRDDGWAELSSSDKDRLLFEARRHSIESDDTNRRNNNNKTDSPEFDGIGFSSGFRQNSDGGSGVGFFELDEELTSPDAGQVRSLEIDRENDEVDPADANEDENGNEDDDKLMGLGLSTISVGRDVINEKKRWSADSASKFGVGSVPIDIVRPSLSVSSSWVGTFGH